MARPASGLVFFITLMSSLILTVYATNKIQDITTPIGINAASSIIAKCLAPLSSAVFGKPELQPACSVEEFSSYSAEALMQLDEKQINSLPPSYFESLKIEQAIPLSPTFIKNLGKEQAMAVPKSVEDALSAKSRKILKKIKRQPGPIARAIIMTLSGFTAFVIFKYS